MTTNKQKVVVAMSGGVDSSVTAGLLLEEGYEVTGVSLRLWDYATGDPRNCSDYRGAKAVADLLGIPHLLLDLRSEFFAGVVRPLAQSYLSARTPNPCITCNRDFKLGFLLSWARAQGTEYLATGHYARVIRNPTTGQVSLLRGADSRKDQSYFLFALSREQLNHTLFPLGGLHKEEVRRIARRLALPVADRAESQDICLGDYRALVESFVEAESLGGEIVNRSGEVLGHHRGIHRLTIGQRRGLGLAAPYPLHVLEIDETTRRVVVGRKEELGARGFVAHGLNWIEPPVEEEFLAEVRVRYRSPSVPCRVHVHGEERCEVSFRDPFPSVTPGQAAVFYDGERVLGGGWIEKAIK